MAGTRALILKVTAFLKAENGLREFPWPRYDPYDPSGMEAQPSEGRQAALLFERQ
jgi:hypothetical protein